MNGRIVVGGGTGFIGKEVVSLFERLDYEVLVISRKKKAKASENWQVKLEILTDRDEEPLNQNTRSWIDIEEDGLPSGTVAVVNTAGQNVLDPLRRWSPGFKQNVYNSRVNTNHLLAKAIARSKVKPKAFVHMSGVGFYPPGLSVQDENSDGGKHDFLAKLVTDWERAAQLPPEVPTRVVSLRSGVVLGVGGSMGAGSQLMPWIHVKDLASLIAHCVFSECSGVYNAVAPQTVTNKQFVKAFAREMGRPAIIPLPEFVLKAVFGAERASIITQSQNVQPTRTLESGFNFSYPTIKEAAEEFAHIMYIDPDAIENEK
eukprot:GFUD01096445.1.p1 GENE.GFUD01096445.1~~GFUD01096445.1.p1  ORF type:complete len:316 (-),score=91.03 GFUD01096445.1:54-1001(-)